MTRYLPLAAAKTCEKGSFHPPTVTQQLPGRKEKTHLLRQLSTLLKYYLLKTTQDSEM